METANNGNFSSCMGRRSDAKLENGSILTWGRYHASNDDLKRAGGLIRTEQKE